jgi:hypothetical protein
MSVPIAAADRPWLAYTTVRLIGPAQVPTVDQLRRALLRLMIERPDHPLVSSIDVERRRFEPVPADDRASWCTLMVSELAAPAGDYATATTGLLAGGTGPAPIRFLVGDGHICFVMSHVLGDARTGNAVIAAALDSRRTDSAFLGLPVPDTARAVRRLLAHHYGRRPWRLVTTLRAPRPAPPGATAAVTGESDAGESDTGESDLAAAAVAAPLPPPDGLPGTDGAGSSPAASEGAEAAAAAELAPLGSVMVAATRVPAGALAAVRSWRRAAAPELSLAMLMFTAARGAFARAGIPVDERGAFLLVDTRRYGGSALAERAGNLAKSVYVAAPETAGPAVLQRALNETIASGRPLAAIAEATLRASRRPGRPGGPALELPAAPEPAAAGAAARPVVLSLTYLGRAAEMRDIDWVADPAERNWLVGTTPGGPDGVTVVFTELGGVLHVSATFDGGQVTPARVRAAVNLLGEPLDLLAETGAGLSAAALVEDRDVAGAVPDRALAGSAAPAAARDR